MTLAHSARGKVLVGAIAAALLVLAYEATVMVPRVVALGTPLGAMAPGERLRYVATAYCKGQITASGVKVRAGIAAGDPALLPQGSVIAVDGVPDKLKGIYTVLDTGPKIKGRRLDLYMWSCHEALDFGKRPVEITVLRLGWNPKQSMPAMK
jgi:3D (Asp-Asp-Asp) domain-containing protein